MGCASHSSGGSAHPGTQSSLLCINTHHPVPSATAKHCPGPQGQERSSQHGHWRECQRWSGATESRLYKSYPLMCSTWTSLLTHLHQDKTVPNTSQHQQSASFTCIICSPFARSRSLPHYCLGLFLFCFFMSTLYIPPFLQIFLPGFLAHSLDILLTEKWIED